MKKTTRFDTQPSIPIPQQRTRQPAQASQYRVSFTNHRLAILAFAVGIFIGLVVLGWGLWPVEYVGGVPYEHLGQQEKALLVDLASDLSAYDPENENVVLLRQKWGEIDDLACFVAAQELNPAKRARLVKLAYEVNRRGCN